jgi:hypothetical protein
VRSHTISVTVGQGSIVVEPEALQMTTQDDVQWSGKNAKTFTIEFDGEGPFGSRKLLHAAATAKQKPRMKGRFKYTVVSDENPRLKLDPVIIIDPPPTVGP